MYGNDDANIIYSGAPITNLTATRWNSFNNRICALGLLNGYSWSYDGVVSGQQITAAMFNLARNRINLLPGHKTPLPGPFNKDEKIMASYLQGSVLQ